MNDYIKRSDIRDAVENTDWYHIGVKGNLVHGANSDLHEPLFKANDIFNAIEAVLPADVVEVIRCRDCRYSQEDKLFGGYWCREERVKGTFYCGKGERKNE